MGKSQDLQPHIVVELIDETKPLKSTETTHQPIPSQQRDSKSWPRIALYTLFVISAQSGAILLGRSYYNKGGKSKWLATLAQLVGFPILAPYYCMISASEKTASPSADKKRPSSFVVAFVYVSLGLLLAANNVLYSIGLLHLPVSLFSLICVSQLAFNALFSLIINSQKFTPYIINALFLLTVSSSLVLFNTSSANPGELSKDKYTMGLLCAVGSSAGYGLMLSLTQLAFEKVLKTESFGAVLELIVCQSLVATLAATMGLFVSGEWIGLKTEMEEFQLGTWSYFVILGGAALAWQLFTVGTMGLVFEVSSLFSNVVGVLGLPFVSVLAVFFFHDTMDGLKGTAMLLALWGFASYLYQQYLDDAKYIAKINHSTEKIQCVKEISMAPLLKEIGD